MKIEVEPNEYLHLLRRRLEMTQGQLARHLGCARGSLARYEIGDSPVPEVTIRTLERLMEEVS
jgi:transcriptional regulator with XRE-family HTH domain